MRIWRKLFGGGAESLKIETQSKARVGLSYVETVFDFDFTSKPERRDWRAISELKDVPNLFYDRNLSRVELLLSTAMSKFPDYYFVYNWYASLYEEQGDVARARQACMDGIRLSNEKHGLCGRLAMLEFGHGTLKDAIKWWIRSIMFQMPGKSVDDAQSFLYLGFVAYLYQLNDASEKLLDASSKGMHGTIALNQQGKQNVSRKVGAEHSMDIPAAIRELTTRRWTGF